MRLSLDAGVRHAERLEIGQHGFEEAWLRLLALFFRGLAVEFRNARAADVESRSYRGRESARAATSALTRPFRTNGPHNATSGSRVSVWITLSRSGCFASKLDERVTENDVAPCLVRVDEGVPEPRVILQRVLQHREVRDAARSGADMHDVIGLRVDVR